MEAENLLHRIRKVRDLLWQYLYALQCYKAAHSENDQKFQLQAGSSLVQNDTGGERPAAG